MYTIQINYKTGYSFHSERKINVIGAWWDDKGLARKALQSIKEHHNIFKYGEEEGIKKAYKFDWFDEDFPMHSLIVEVDDGSKQKICAFWFGYFEYLDSAKIVSEVDDEDHFEV